MTKISLAYLNNKDLLKEIAEYDPVLIYYICHLEQRSEFTSHIFDFEMDCSALDKWDLVKYLPPRERSGHTPNCSLRATSRSIAQELIKSGICTKLSNFHQLEENGKHITIDREKFKELFWNKFTFDEDPEYLIENRLNELKNILGFSLPPNNYTTPYKQGCRLVFNYSLEEKSFIIKVECSCSNKPIITIREDDKISEPYSNYTLECDRCEKSFTVSFNFYQFDIISPQ